MPPRPAFALPAVLLLLVACDPGEAPGAPDAGVERAAPAATPAPASPTTTPAATDEAEATATPSEQAGDPCGADKVRTRWLNALPTDEVKAAIAEAVGERRIRYYGEDDAITMDFSADRLNVVTGADGRIKEFRCG